MNARDDLAAVMNGHPHFLDGRSMLAGGHDE